jgi:anti-sigma factor RsiW
MSNHLSEDQFEACVLDRAGQPELAHINKCPECQAEFEHFRKALSMFRSVVWDLADTRAALQSSEVTASSLSSSAIPKWRWALVVTAFVVAVMIPILVSQTSPLKPPKPVDQMSPEAVMDRLNQHLARRVPAPMEPMMSLISTEPFAAKPGAVQ